MKKYDKRSEEESQYQRLKTIQMSNASEFCEHFIGSRKKLFTKGHMIATTAQSSNLYIGSITQSQFTSFLGRFNKDLYAQFYKKPELYDLKIEFSGISKQKNNDTWEKMKVKEPFYNIDLSSAYWQIAYRLGYISDNLFNDFFENDSYKSAKRYCISFLARRNEMHYTTLSGTTVISCDISVLKTVYNNIRNELYNCIAYSVEELDEWLEINIDGVMVRSNQLKESLQRFSEMNLKVKINRCQKVSENTYTYKGVEKQFKRR